jgi:cell division control protein 6
VCKYALFSGLQWGTVIISGNPIKKLVVIFIKVKFVVSEIKKFNIDQFFNDYITKPSLFKDINALNSSFLPDDLPHRDEQIKGIAQVMALTLKNNTPSNLFLYGKTGTGKTAVVKHVSKKIDQKCKEIGIQAPCWIYINCNQVTTSYRVMANICNKVDPEHPVPNSGLPVDVLLNTMFRLLDQKLPKAICFIILDEIDCLKDKGSKDNVLYTLSRINETLKFCKVNIIGISNVLNFKDELDPRVCSSLSEEEMVFPAYNATELYDILKARVDFAFEKDVVTEGALRLCAAIAAKENGDARRALSLLRKAAEIIERRGLNVLTEEYIFLAQDQLDRDKTAVFISDLPVQQKLILVSIYINHKCKNGEESSTGEIYNTYCELQQQALNMSQLTPRRVIDLVKELDLSGITESRVISFGKRGGRTRMIALKVSDAQIQRSLGNDNRWSDYLKYFPEHIKNRDINVIEGRKYQKLL